MDGVREAPSRPFGLPGRSSKSTNTSRFRTIYECVLKVRIRGIRCGSYGRNLRSLQVSAVRLPFDSGTVKFVVAAPTEPVLDYETPALKLDGNDTPLYAIPLFAAGGRLRGLDHVESRRRREGSQRVHGGEGHQLQRHDMGGRFQPWGELPS